MPCSMYQGTDSSVSLVRRAREAIQAAYGESVKVVSVPAREILCGGGNLHCMSMQMVQA